MTKIDKILAAVGGVLLLALVLGGSWAELRRVRAERDRYRDNMNVLAGEAEQYRVRDSLNAARIGALELTAKEYKRIHAEDAALIRELSGRARDLERVTATQAQTIIELQSVPHDTVVIREAVEVPAKVVRCGDAWYDFEGLLTPAEFTGRLAVRDSLLVAENVRYGRFLGFLWKTKRVKNRRVDVVSRNPHTTIQDIQFITIKQ